MRFAKYHCLGGDYLLVEETARICPEMVVRLCHRTRGVGGQALISYRQVNAQQYVVKIYTPWGKRISVSGNGFCCLASHLANQGTRGTVIFDADAGLLPVDIGQQIVATLGNALHLGEYQVANDFAGHLVQLGRPFFIIQVESLAALDLGRWGLAIEEFFGGINIVFAELGAELAARVWMQGLGEVESSGTGAGALVFSLGQGITGKEIPVIMPGGEVIIGQDQGGIRQRGQAQLICQGLIAQLKDNACPLKN